MPFRLKLRRTRRYNVLSKNYFVTRIRLLDANVIECTLSVDSTGQECLEAVAQRLELRETHFFGLWFHGRAQQQQQQQQRWVELEKPLKKQLDKFGNEPLLFFGVMFYVPSVTRLEQEATRYQYYLQVKKEVLDGRLHCTVEQGIRLAGLAVQADFGDYNQFASQDFLREYVLFPVNWPVEGVLEEWTQKVAEEHKRHCRMQTAEAELLYIKEVEKLDGFGQESFAAKDNYTNDIFIGVSFIGVFVKHRNGRSIMLHRWKDIGTIAHNKSAITVEITSRDDTIMFHTEDIEMAKYIARLFTARHKFYKQNKICAEPAHSPAPIRRRPTWNRLPRPQSCILQYADHYQDTQSSQDSIFHDDPYFKSESSLDRCVLDLGFRNGGAVLNGSMCSSPSVSSLNRSQTFTQASHLVPSPSLSTPEETSLPLAVQPTGAAGLPYRPIRSRRCDAQKQRRSSSSPQRSARPNQHAPQRRSADSHSLSLRSLNISHAHAYRHPEALVNSQPEIRERAGGLYHGGQYGGVAGGGGHPLGYGGMGGHHAGPLPGAHAGGTGGMMGCRSGGMASGGGGGVGSAISHTVSTPELANPMQPCGGGGAQAGGGHMLRNHLSRPPPPYPAFRPATSTPDLVSLRQRCLGGSTPELLHAQKLPLAVPRTFQPDSCAVVRQSLQEASATLTPASSSSGPGSAQRRANLSKRHSMEVVPLGGGGGAGRAGGGATGAAGQSQLPLLRRNTLREQLASSGPPTQPQPPKEASSQMPAQKAEAYQHQKSLSNATMLVHSSESDSEDEEEDEAPELDVRIPGLHDDISAQLQAALAKLPSKPPPDYPGPPRHSGRSQRQEQPPHPTHTHTHAHTHARADRRWRWRLARDLAAGKPGSTGPSIESDLTSVKGPCQRDLPVKAPDVECLSIEDNASWRRDAGG
ncbi:hypothetical protein AALO_G00119020 [Alosa alosa]|uniref:protein-tyrosine-phosphatase n=1 Tax=Alosa alosa TaxID=278164 RepID=A0AAV6GUI1_9TELE|nr:hypothetical protein AALO_G00119020 [Alosa alosa]